MTSRGSRYQCSLSTPVLIYKKPIKMALNTNSQIHRVERRLPGPGGREGKHKDVKRHEVQLCKMSKFCRIGVNVTVDDTVLCIKYLLRR